MKNEDISQSPVLIVDDEEHILKSFASTLRSFGVSLVLTCSDSREVMGIVRGQDIEVILLDLSMPHISGHRLLQELRDEFPQIPVIVVTGTNEVEAAVECMKAGAFDYMVKAVEENRLVSGVKRALEIRRLQREYRELRNRLFSHELSQPEAFSHIVTQNPRILSIFLYVESIARSREPILITGETGVGKNLFALAVHKTSGVQGDLVEVNVAGLDDSMFSDTLFGHRKGAFTGATSPREGLIGTAAGGTLFLDEIGDLSMQSQIKLLRLLDSRQYYPLGSDLAKRTDARVLVATNRDVEALFEKGALRKDLYYRLSIHDIRIPPLRERKDDLPHLLDYFMKSASRDLSLKPPATPPEILPLLEAYHFPGNVRELRSMIYDAVSRQSKGTISLSPFRETIGRGVRHASPAPSQKPVSFGDRLPTLKEVSDLLIEEALERSKGNQSIAADLLGISHQALNKRLQRKG